VKGNLKKITDKTIQDLLQNEIILPSSYFKSFDKNARDFDVELNAPDFENEISELIIEELNNINRYMNKAVENIDMISSTAEDAQQAIKDNDAPRLKRLNSKLIKMKNDISELKNQIYLDPLTQTYSRRWIYNQAINNDGSFKAEGLLLFINLVDCDYLAHKYGNLLADNVIQYIAKFLSNKFNAENLVYEIARYSNNQFIIFIKDETVESLNSFVKNIRLLLGNTTLKSKAGLMFKTTFNFGIVEYHSMNNFQDSLEKAASASFQSNELTITK